MIKWIGIIIVSLVVLSSCEKAINFTPKSAEPRLVVEATIESDQPPVVILSNSLDYFSEISPEKLLNSFVRNAEITISNGTKTHQLKEYSTDLGNGYSLYYYSIDSANLGTAFLGEFAKSYSMSIKTNGKEYTATTTIPALTKTIDSLWWVKPPSHDDSNKVTLMGRTTDPKGFGNYIRYFTRVNKDQFYPGLNSVFDDQVVDGKTYSIQIERGVNRNEDIDFDEYSFFDKGDTVTVKMTNIDKATFDFWRTIEYSYQSIGNPFSSPTKVLSNIQNGLGYFGGYAVQYKTLIIPK